MNIDIKKEKLKTVWEQRYLKLYEKFIKKVIEWQPDFIIPVARKSCKLFGSLEDLFREVRNRVYYIDYFEFMGVSLKNKKIAIIDDAVRRTSTLKDYRNRLVRKGASEHNIKTFGFIGHRHLLDNPSLKCDEDAIISYFMPPAAYEEYLIHQSNHLILKGAHQDIDHLVLEVEVTDISSDDIEKLWDFLAQEGYLYQLEPVMSIERFGVHCPRFFSINNVISNLDLPIESDFVEKIRFTFLKKERRLLCVPMIFPKLYALNGDLCKLRSCMDSKLPFTLPCQFRDLHSIGKFCYLSTCLLLDSLLARKFLLTLRKSYPQLYDFFGKFKIRQADLVRYLGEHIGKTISTQIEKFIKEDSSPFDQDIISRSENCFRVLSSSLPLSRKSIPIILQHLRAGYKNAVRENNNNPVGIKYTKPVDYLLQIDKGIHPLMFTELLDELCDLGVIVPVTDFVEEEKCWRRVYRTGEPLPDGFPWKRSKNIIALVIQTLASGGVEPMFLQKAMANFVYDFPSNISKLSENYPELHCFVPQPSYWGTQVFIAHPMSQDLLPLSPAKLKDDDLKKWKEFAELFEFDNKTKKFISSFPLKGISELFDAKCRVDHRLIRDYFHLLAELKKEFGGVDILNELALCRDKDWFYRHFMWNIYSWTGCYDNFLKGLRYGQFNKEYLHEAGLMAKSARGKIKIAANFLNDYPRCKQVVDKKPEYFEDIWNEHIEPHIIMADHPLLNIPHINQASKIVKAISALDGATRLRLDVVRGSQKEKTKKKVYELGPKEFQDLKIDADIIQFSEGKSKTPQEVHQEAREIYNSIVSKFKEIPAPQEDLMEIRKNAAIRRVSMFAKFFQQGIPEKFEENLLQIVERIAKEFNLKDPTFASEKNLSNGGVLLTIGGSFGEKVVVQIDNKGRVREKKRINT